MKERAGKKGIKTEGERKEDGPLGGKGRGKRQHRDSDTAQPGRATHTRILLKRMNFAHDNINLMDLGWVLPKTQDPVEN